MTLVELTPIQVQFLLGLSVSGGIVIGLVMGWAVWGRA